MPMPRSAFEDQLGAVAYAHACASTAAATSAADSQRAPITCCAADSQRGARPHSVPRSAISPSRSTADSKVRVVKATGFAVKPTADERPSPSTTSRPSARRAPGGLSSPLAASAHTMAGAEAQPACVRQEVTSESPEPQRAPLQHAPLQQRLPQPVPNPAGCDTRQLSAVRVSATKSVSPPVAGCAAPKNYRPTAETQLEAALVNVCQTVERMAERMDMMDKKIDRISQTFEAKLILLEGQLKFMQGSSYAAPETSLASHGSAYLQTSHGSAYHAPQQIPNGMHHKAQPTVKVDGLLGGSVQTRFKSEPMGAATSEPCSTHQNVARAQDSAAAVPWASTTFGGSSSDGNTLPTTWTDCASQSAAASGSSIEPVDVGSSGSRHTTAGPHCAAVLQTGPPVRSAMDTKSFIQCISERFKETEELLKSSAPLRSDTENIENGASAEAH